MMFFKKSDPPEVQSPAVESDEIEDLRKAVRQARLPEATAAVAEKELERLTKTDPSLPEYAIAANYVEFLISLPWNRQTDDDLDLARAEKILESRHHGLGHVKERILEYLAVQTLCSKQQFHVLVVDDEEIARANLEHVLAKEGYSVSTAGNGLEALEKVRDQEFDLILTDLKMEKMDGRQLLESVKGFRPHTEIVMITGFATVNSAVDALRKGAAHYLPKPVNLDELRSVVRQILEKKKHLQMTRSPILCFTGPPGTGKTSIGQSIAEALGRKFVRISLAGLRDEAELRGHRRTYVGAMAGRILNEIRRAEVKNPVFMLDEIDKIGQDFRGDPASVLLEILDPEQNSHYVDHYLDVAFDLSRAMFIATANVVERIPGPLLDRLEVIPFPGYTEKEKLRIAQSFLVPRQLRENGLRRHGITFSDEAVLRVIRDYTREAGLRGLERALATICRKLARICVGNLAAQSAVEVDGALAEKLLGPRRYTREAAETAHQIGMTTGLVWTEFGGEILFVEATVMNGSQQLILTGSLGSVLQESAQTALSYIRSHTEGLGIDPDFFRGKDLHIHIPAGSIPKDGPSAGLTIALAVISRLAGRPARRDVAMTGELTLSGRILPVSGVREKILAAQRAGIRCVVLPKSNEVDVAALEPDVREGVEVILAENLPEVIDRVMQKDRDHSSM